MKLYTVISTLMFVFLSGCNLGSSSGVTGTQGEAYVVHSASTSGEIKQLLYKTDGTSGGTVLLHTPLTPNTDHSAFLDGIVKHGDFVYFSESIKNEIAPLASSAKRFYQLNEATGAVTPQPFLANNLPFGKIRTLIVDDILFAYQTETPGGSAPSRLELVAYSQSGIAIDLSSLFASYDMFFGEAIAIDRKLYFLSKAGFVEFDLDGGTVSEKLIPVPDRSIFLGTVDGILYIMAGDFTPNTARLYSYDPAIPNTTPAVVTNTSFTNMHGGKIPTSGNYLLGSDDANLVAYNVQTNAVTSLLPCVNIVMLREGNDRAHIACPQTSSGYIDIAHVGVSGNVPTAQMISTAQEGRIIDFVKDYGILDDKLYYNGDDSSAHKVFVWDMVSGTTTPLIQNNDTFHNASGFTAHDGDLIFSAHRPSQPGVRQLLKLDPDSMNLVVLQ